MGFDQNEGNASDTLGLDKLDKVPSAHSISFGAVLLRAARNACTPRQGDWAHALRVLLVLTGIGYGGFGLYHTAPSRNDAKSIYPAYEQLEVSSGELILVITRRFDNFVLKPADWPSSTSLTKETRARNHLSIVTDYSLRRPLIDQGWEVKQKFTPHFVTIKYFRLPSQRIWLAEISHKGKVLIDYEQRKSDFLDWRKRRDDMDTEDYISILAAAVALMWIIFEAFNQVKQESKNQPKESA